MTSIPSASCLRVALKRRYAAPRPVQSEPGNPERYVLYTGTYCPECLSRAITLVDVSETVRTSIKARLLASPGMEQQRCSPSDRVLISEVGPARINFVRDQLLASCCPTRRPRDSPEADRRRFAPCKSYFADPIIDYSLAYCTNYVGAQSSHLHV